MSLKVLSAYDVTCHIDGLPRQLSHGRAALHDALDTLQQLPVQPVGLPAAQEASMHVGPRPAQPVAPAPDGRVPCTSRHMATRFAVAPESRRGAFVQAPEACTIETQATGARPLNDKLLWCRIGHPRCTPVSQNCRSARTFCHEAVPRKEITIRSSLHAMST
jgi:hypothetical protein